MTWVDLWLAAILFLTTLIYACLLELHDRRIEPERASDRTVWKVIIGTFLVLLAVAVDVHLQPWLSGWQTVQRTVLAFGIGGVPISVWQFWLGWRRRDRAIAYLQRRHHGDQATAVAESRRTEEG